MWVLWFIYLFYNWPGLLMRSTCFALCQDIACWLGLVPKKSRAENKPISCESIFQFECPYYRNGHNQKVSRIVWKVGTGQSVLPKGPWGKDSTCSQWMSNSTPTHLRVVKILRPTWHSFPESCVSGFQGFSSLLLPKKMGKTLTQILILPKRAMKMSMPISRGLKLIALLYISLN